jgi:hypothetical protein
MTRQSRPRESQRQLHIRPANGQDQHVEEHGAYLLEKYLREFREDPPEDRRHLRAQAHIILAALDLIEAEDCLEEGVEENGEEKRRSGG